MKTPANRWSFTIADQGKGLDPEHLPDPLAPENLLRGTGRGIFLIRSFMDEVHFRQLHPGTELTLVKHLAPANEKRTALHMQRRGGHRRSQPQLGKLDASRSSHRRQWCYNRITPKGGISVALTIASREVDGVTVLDLSGRITLGEGSVQLREAIRDLIGKGRKSILLNLGDVNYIDSSGLGELVSAYTTSKNQGAALKLLSLTKKVKDVLQLTKLYTVFDIYDDEASAIASYK